MDTGWSRYVHLPGILLRITEIVSPDYDSYAVIHMGRWAFGCSRAWFEAQRPLVGGYIDIDPSTGGRLFVSEADAAKREKA